MTTTRFALLVWLLAVMPHEPAAQAPDAWPPPGVLLPGNGVTAPIVVSRVSPTYSPDAMRQRLQGFVSLRFVVEPDGSVSRVQVVTSLAASLDAAAVSALQRWRFRPGTRGDEPVPVAAQAVLTFAIRGEPPPMTLPAGFDAVSGLTDDAWTETTVETDDVTVDLAYPAGWRRADSSSSVVAVVDVDSMHSFGVLRPGNLPAPLPFPMPLHDLARFSDLMKARFASQERQAIVMAVGQSRLGGTNWLWLELEASSVFPADVFVPPAIRDTVEGARVWAFMTTLDSQLIQAMCTAPYIVGESAAERAASLAAAQRDCSGILTRLSVTARCVAGAGGAYSARSVSTGASRRRRDAAARPASAAHTSIIAATET